MFVTTTKLRIRYGETDRMGYVYYGVYPQFFEVGRVESIRELGITYKDMEDKIGVMLPVKSLNIKYLRPIFYDEIITIKTTISAVPDRNITFHQEIMKESGEITTFGTVVLSFVDVKTKSVVSIPDGFLIKLLPYFESNK